MSTKIHHGPPGSYKTSGAIQDDILPELLKGRVVITNIRGLTTDNVREGLKKIKGGKGVEVEIINLDTSLTESREKLRRFFHWAPKGALICIDEVNTIYPVEWRETKLAELDYTGGLDKATSDNRPANVVVAFEMHRHHNWDFVVTTPNISKVHRIIRDTAEVAYRHQNRAIIGLKGSYWQVMHTADNLGKTQGDRLEQETRSIKKTTFGLYQSTATGQIRDSIAGQNIFTKPRTLLFGAALLGYLGYMGYNLATSNVGQTVLGSKPEAGEGDDKVVLHPVSNAPDSFGRGPSLQGRTRSPSTPDITMPLDGFQIYYHGTIGAIGHFSASSGKGKSLSFSTLDLFKMGYRVNVVSQCFVILKTKSRDLNVFCEPREILDKGNSGRQGLDLPNPVQEIKEAL